MRNEAAMAGKELTGRKVFIITASAFAVIIGVNLFMAYQAVGTFPGLETRNSYVASQRFEADRAAQQALGWNVAARIKGDTLIVDVLKDGAPVELAEIGGILGRPTHVADDQTPVFRRDSNGAYVADIGTLASGGWDLRLAATALDGTDYRRRIKLYIRKN